METGVQEIGKILKTLDSGFCRNDVKKTQIDFFIPSPIKGEGIYFLISAMPIYESVHNRVDTQDEIPPSLPLQKGGIPLFEKEGLGEIWEGYVWSIMDSLVSCFRAAGDNR